MAIAKDRTITRQLAALFDAGAIRALTDGQLLERYRRGDGEPAELAFAALVERHGEMVLRVCRARLADPQDRQDAFQATFLVLIERARSLWVRDSLGPWLHQVALRTASRARASAIRRRRLEGEAAEVAANREPHEAGVPPEVAAVLHEEIGRLPGRYRVPIVLCDLEGRTCEEAARLLGRPVGTIKSWRSRGRDLLRRRLIRAGLAPAIGIEAVIAADIARASGSDATAGRMVRAAIRMGSEGSGVGIVPASVRTLSRGVARSMLRQQGGMILAGLLVAAGLGTGIAAAMQAGGDGARRPADAAAGAAHRRPAAPPPPDVPAAAAPGGETWPLSLRDAIRIGLENSEAVRVIEPDAKGGPAEGREAARPGAADGVSPLVIAPASPTGDLERFRSDVMGKVRRIAFEYWFLSAAHVRVWASERAVAEAKEIRDREQAELVAGKGVVGDVAEAAQRLEQFSLDLVTRTSDLMTHERQLRKLMGTPAADNRRIVPTTPPRHVEDPPALKRCLADLFANQPEVLRAKRLLTDGQGHRAEDLDGAAEALIPELADGAGGPAALHEAQALLEPFGAGSLALRQAIDQARGAVVRSRQEAEQKSRQFQNAARLRIAAGQRLDAQRAYHEERRITIDRILDAVSQYYDSVGKEADYRAQYAIAMDSLEADEGTLLKTAGIATAEAPRSEPAPLHRQAIGAGRAAEAAERPRAGEDAPGTDTTGRTFSFHFTLKTGPRPIEVHGSFTVGPAR
ncbi:ECF RNA polymerase sigma factor SigW [Aquisphaera giovannonii]|uniref:ECF RNA polymerase sigma factor SigW n=1 Tax=Aquisphaera giovannonii TaxID=406548 RepID=A0A5B9WC77_9BACT|nr:sigma-70 family RNA polymerase sigma factor [Aquisphaera giovannonii]QEH37490.1 ECF RNA polymerase sigma factor SigW [Aquisphaera giovannonii]